MKSQIRIINETIEVGPRKVTRIGGRAAVYLGRRLNFLIGRDVIVVIRVLVQARLKPMHSLGLIVDNGLSAFVVNDLDSKPVSLLPTKRFDISLGHSNEVNAGACLFGLEANLLSHPHLPVDNRRNRLKTLVSGTDFWHKLYMGQTQISTTEKRCRKMAQTISRTITLGSLEARVARLERELQELRELIESIDGLLAEVGEKEGW